jgi:hypothetical protein
MKCFLASIFSGKGINFKGMSVSESKNACGITLSSKFSVNFDYGIIHYTTLSRLASQEIRRYK